MSQNIPDTSYVPIYDTVIFKLSNIWKKCDSDMHREFLSNNYHRIIKILIGIFFSDITWVFFFISHM